MSSQSVAEGEPDEGEPSEVGVVPGASAATLSDADVDGGVDVEVGAEPLDEAAQPDEESGGIPPRYSFDASTVPDLAKRIDDACETKGRARHVGDEIRGGPGIRFGDVSADVAEASLAFWYRIDVGRGEQSRPGAELEPLRPTETPHWLVPIRSASDDEKQLWAALADAVTHPLARARFHDLCFSARVGNGRDHGIAAVDAYLELEAVGAEIHDGVDGLCRAWTLAKKVRDEPAIERVEEAIDGLAALMLDSDDLKPGLVLPLLEILADSPSDPEGDRTDVLLERALGRFTRSDVIAKVTRLQHARTTDPSRRAAANRRLVQAILDDADAATHPLVRMSHLESAAAAAHRHGVKDLADHAVREMQKLKDEDLQWITITAESELPPTVAEGYLRGFDESPDWQSALEQFLMTDAPTGDAAANRKSAEQSASSFIHKLFPAKRFGRHSLPETSASSEEEQILADMVQSELMHARFIGQLLAEGLRRIPATFGEPDRDAVAAFVAETYRCDPLLARSFATALWLFWHEEYEACVHLAVPKVEGALRAVLLLLDEPLYRVEEVKKPGQFPGLAVLVAALMSHDFDEDWKRAIHALLLPGGDNERNLVAHGFVALSTPSGAAVLLRLCGMAVTLAPPGSTDEDLKRVLDRLARPAAPPPRSWWLRVRRRIARAKRRVARRRSR